MCAGFRGQVCRAGSRPEMEDRRGPEVYLKEAEIPVGLRSKIPERGREERDEGAAEVILAVVDNVLIKIVPGVFALIH